MNQTVLFQHVSFKRTFAFCLLLLGFCGGFANAGTNRVQGDVNFKMIVQNENGQPLPNVTVTVKLGKTNPIEGTSDAKGELLFVFPRDLQGKSAVISINGKELEKLRVPVIDEQTTMNQTLTVSIPSSLAYPSASGPATVPASAVSKSPVKTTEVSDADFAEKIVRSKGITAILYWSVSNEPSRQLLSQLEEAAREYPSQVAVFVLDADKKSEIARAQSLKSVPTLLLFKEGRLAAKVTGSPPGGKKDILSYFKSIH